MGVVDDLVADIDRRAEALDRALDDRHRAVDAGAEAARRGDEDAQVRQAGKRRRGNHAWQAVRYQRDAHHNLCAWPPVPMLRPIVAKGFSLVHLTRVAAAAAALAVLAGCQHNPLLVQRSACPAVAVPNFTGDTTLFRGDGTAASDIDVVAVVTNVRGVCADAGDRLGTNISFDVVARRTATAGARTVTLPFFASVVQGGNLLVSKQIGAVTVTFADGQARAPGDSACPCRGRPRRDAAQRRDGQEGQPRAQARRSRRGDRPARRSRGQGGRSARRRSRCSSASS